MCKKKGAAHTNECQFYVTTSAPLSFLDNKYTVFGRVVQGMRFFKILDKNEAVNENPITAAKIVEGGDYQYLKDGSRQGSKQGSRLGSRLGSRGAKR